MPSNCAVYGCDSDYSKKVDGISFFQFPRNATFRRRWLHLCNRKDAVNVERARICSLHFESGSYKRHLKYELLDQPIPARLKRLKDDALPRLHLPLSEGRFPCCVFVLSTLPFLDIL